ncbi:hypothetical protein VOLCADRAFT_88172 [Volvox carteri f. nagariensis]|uniref:WSC domain-containing protein n=1 Tax=Volvox carteri f. nagariensis TaxID=3068 RepID=D8TNG7_VOLCA|nr:uncharacterized protein VOLCADRAFT_88172 [Volvox carteri f. nagariensis]EFJ50991.1 hypothetical protein VOLCADRAFT_88172 [Volvox carteri f. nagariensis]|eukprot:XP_002948003.1 hypothetical protein VOLCADRAFT_88172 [Volvox carteri f. nagariensis]
MARLVSLLPCAAGKQRSRQLPYRDDVEAKMSAADNLSTFHLSNLSPSRFLSVGYLFVVITQQQLGATIRWPATSKHECLAAEGYYIGCYNDRKSNSSRLLPVFLAYNKQFVTPLRCASLARAAGLKLYGVQFRGQCYGGNDLALATSLGESAACTMNCTGDNSKICGGTWSNSLYSLVANPPPPGPPPPNPIPIPAEGIPLGCYNDRKSNSSRLLPVFLAYNKQYVTPSTCANLARAAGLKLYGVQFRGQCYGGNDLALATSLGTSTGCTMNCTGDNSKTCGGSWSNSLYSLIVPHLIVHVRYKCHAQLLISSSPRPCSPSSPPPLIQPPKSLGTARGHLAGSLGHSSHSAWAVLNPRNWTSRRLIAIIHVPAASCREDGFYLKRCM